MSRPDHESQNWEILEVTPKDFDECLSLFDSNVPRYFLAKERQEYLDFLESACGPYWIMRNETGKPLACGGVASNIPRETSLCWGMVEGCLHGKGLGKRLLDYRLAVAAENPEWLSVVSNTTQLTEGFFRRFGFETEKVVPDHYGPGLHWVAMRLWLTEEQRSSIRKRCSTS